MMVVEVCVVREVGPSSAVQPTSDCPRAPH